MKGIALLFRFGPIWFGIGFLAPVIAAAIAAAGIAAPFGIAPIAIGLVAGTALGALAMIRGTWL